MSLVNNGIGEVKEMTQQADRPQVDVLGIPMYGGGIDDATNLILSGCDDEDRRNACISATGAHGLVYAKQEPQFRSALKNFFLNLPDGMPGVWIGRLKGAKQMKRCYGPAFFESVMRHSADKSITHFFCGGNNGVALELKDAVKRKFHNVNIVGTFCPPFLPVDAYDYQSIAEQINTTRASIVWIGLSTPKQELFAMNLSRMTKVNYIVTVGAAFDFHTDRLSQAPAFLQKMGLEWFFRLMMEPKRLYKRYLEIVPLFIYYNLRELLTFASRKSNQN